ncbi:MAG TPA: hypothetical protein VG125_07530 [Pirellulales bacterium]|jgi:hypothetical protein|nr:hypothetical protein [Pirellulales bacterium]
MDQRKLETRERQQKARDDATNAINALADVGIGAILITFGAPSLGPAPVGAIQLQAEKNKLIADEELRKFLQMVLDRLP